MATHAISWVPGTHVCFDDLDFIITLGGELALAHTAVQSLPSINLSHLRLKGQPGDSLGPQLSREASRHITLFPEGPVRSTPIVFPFGLRNAAATAGHLLALRMVQPPTDSEFMGTIEPDMETLHWLLTEGLGSSSSSNSSRGSHYPSRECFMVQTPEGHVESIFKEEATPTSNPDGRSKGGSGPISLKDGVATSPKTRDR